MEAALPGLDRPWVRMAPAAGRPVAWAWAVRAADAVDLERPNQLVQGGPYAYGRNPMYVAWTVAYVGAALVAGTAWPLLLLPVVLVVTQVVVLREERSLERRFGVATETTRPRSADTFDVDSRRRVRCAMIARHGDLFDDPNDG
jgi:Phospholipid methyltransferase